jgi:hypothetical protein
MHFGLTSRRDLPGIEDLRAAGLLDPVDEAMERATRMGHLTHPCAMIRPDYWQWAMNAPR